MKEGVFKKYATIIGRVLTIASIIILIDIFVDSYHKINNVEWELYSISIIILCIISSILGYAVFSYTWVLQLKCKYPFFLFYESFRVIGLTQIAKYLPGNVGHYLGRAFLVAGKISKSDIVYSMFVESIVMVSAYLALGLLYLYYFDVSVDISIFTIMVLLSVLIVGGVISYFVVNRLRETLNFLRLDTYTLIKIFLVFILMSGGGGFVIYLLIHLVDSSAGVTFLQCVSGFSLSFLVGFLIPGAPGGIGVREYAFVLLFAPFIGDAKALEVILIFRLISIFGDLVLFLIARHFMKPGLEEA